MTLLVESPTLNLIKLLGKRVNRSHQNDCNNNLDDKKHESNISLRLDEI